MILCSDLHIRDTKPRCRTDNYWIKQWAKLSQILDIAKNRHCEVIIAGDVFDSGHVQDKTIERLMMLIDHFGVSVYAIAGNHDLPGHNLKNINNSAIGIMFASGLIKNKHSDLVDMINFGEKIPNKTRAKILVYHELMYLGKKPFTGAPDSGNAKRFFRKHKNTYDLILTGDNHQQFSYTEHKFGEQGTIMVNPGSMMRMKADQEDFEPAVFYYNYVESYVEKIKLNIDHGVISRDHIEEKKDKENRSKAFIQRMKDTNIKLDFRENMETFLKTNKVNDKTQDLIWEAVDGSI